MSIAGDLPKKIAKLTAERRRLVYTLRAMMFNRSADEERNAQITHAAEGLKALAKAQGLKSVPRQWTNQLLRALKTKHNKPGKPFTLTPLQVEGVVFDVVTRGNFVAAGKHGKLTRAIRASIAKEWEVSIARVDHICGWAKELQGRTDKAIDQGQSFDWDTAVDLSQIPAHHLAAVKAGYSAGIAALEGAGLTIDALTKKLTRGKARGK